MAYHLITKATALQQQQRRQASDLPQGRCHSETDDKQTKVVQPVRCWNPQNVFKKECVKLHNLKIKRLGSEFESTNQLKQIVVIPMKMKNT